jgi:hypothetical protein
MYGGKTTLYEILGVARDAKVTDIGRAYNKYRAEQQDETVAPDHRRAALVRDAYEILSDPVRREAYDESLRNPKILFNKAKDKVNPLYVGIGFAVVIALGAAYMALRPRTNPWDKQRSSADIANSATVAVARLHGIDMSGKSRNIGLAFAIGEGVMATSCQGISPGMELVVDVVPRKVAARVMTADDERGLCKLAAGGVGGWPLAFSGGDPKPGDKVYQTKVNAVGEASLKEGTVKRVVPEAHGKVVETSIPIPPEGHGGPLLDMFGRVVAVASLSPADGKPRYVSVPLSWIVQATGPPPKAAARPEVPRTVDSPSTVEDVPSDVDEAPRKGPKVSKERKEALEKAFRPPPNIPDDL